jgi:ubiquinone/menaquinone biosynthesis C-methylase UbiE
MHMDQKELWFMNSPCRRFFQKWCEFRIFKKHLKKNQIDLTDKVILDVGCGSGYSCELIMKEFEPKELFAFDIMPEEIELAKRRRLTANLFVADATDTKLPADKFDAVFVFGLLHHISGWERALAEMNRVLKNDGVLLLEEPNRTAVNGLERYLRIRTPKEASFDWPALVEGLKGTGFRVIENTMVYLWYFRSFMCLKLID